MTKKTWTIPSILDIPSLEVEAESFVKAVEKVKNKLSYADLHGVDLSGADLSGASLRYASLSYADLSGADLEGVNLSGAKGRPRLG